MNWLLFEDSVLVFCHETFFVQSLVRNCRINFTDDGWSLCEINIFDSIDFKDCSFNAKRRCQKGVALLVVPQGVAALYA